MKTLMMIRRMKEVLTWVWIAVIGTAICLNVCAQTCLLYTSPSPRDCS